MAILIITAWLLRTDLGEEINEYLIPLLRSGIYEVYFHIIPLCSLTNTTDSTVQHSIVFFALSLRMDMELQISMSTYYCKQYINFKLQQRIQKSAFHVFQSEAEKKLSIQLYRISPDVYSRLLLLLIGILKL